MAMERFAGMNGGGKLLRSIDVGNGKCNIDVSRLEACGHIHNSELACIKRTPDLRKTVAAVKPAKRINNALGIAQQNGL